MSKQTFIEFLAEVDFSDVELQRQHDQQQAAARRAQQDRTQGPQDFRDKMAQSRNPNKPQKGDVIFSPKYNRNFPVLGITLQNGQEMIQLKGFDKPIPMRNFKVTGKTDLGKTIFTPA